MDAAGAEEACPNIEVSPIEGMSNTVFILPGKYRSDCLKGLITGYTTDGGTTYDMQWL